MACVVWICHQVGHVRQCFLITFDKKVRNLLFVTLISSPLPPLPSILYDNLSENEIRMPGTQGKMGIEISGAQCLPATLYDRQQCPSEIKNSCNRQETYHGTSDCPTQDSCVSNANDQKLRCEIVARSLSGVLRYHHFLSNERTVL